MKRPASFALGRLKTGQMNQMEADYARFLDEKIVDGLVQWYRFEGVKLRLADNTFYTPDFVVMDHNGFIECHECKGFWTDDGRVKIKVAASQYPFRFIAVKKEAKKRGGGWKVEDF
jgi:G:T-mismatch repair DNA endonuclease (very short patch repair protein)